MKLRRTIVFTIHLPTSVTVIIGRGCFRHPFVNNMTPGQNVNTPTCILLWIWHKLKKKKEKEKEKKLRVIAAVAYSYSSSFIEQVKSRERLKYFVLFNPVFNFSIDKTYCSFILGYFQSFGFFVFQRIPGTMTHIEQYML